MGHAMAVTTRILRGGNAPTSSQRKLMDDEEEEEISSNEVQPNDEVWIDIDDSVEETQDETMVRSRGRGDTSKGRASEGNSASIQEQPSVQSSPQGRYQLKDESSSSHSTSEDSKSASQDSKPSVTPVTEGQDTPV
nr:uncharacterized protein LOC104120251 [Nicotiana tomentosiformis]